MKTQQGGFAVGLIVGLLIGLVLALGVALYITKVPVPFINKVPQRSAEQDAAEAERNKNWDPNAPLGGKPAARAAPAGAGSTTAAAPPAAVATPSATTPATVTTARPVPVGAAPAPSAPKAAKPGADAMLYFAQAGAFTRSDDAEAQRAKLALLGMDAKVSERDQSGRTIYRVRVGPFEARTKAEATIETLQAAGVDSSLVRVERQ